MSDTGAMKITWRRGDGPTYVGIVSRGSDAIRLIGRDPILGIDVALAIPVDEIVFVGVSEPADASSDGPSVIIDLVDSPPIRVRPVGGTSLHAHLLARALGALTPAPAVLARGGRS